VLKFANSGHNDKKVHDDEISTLAPELQGFKDEAGNYESYLLKNKVDVFCLGALIY
jgi:hypothetical protein